MALQPFNSIIYDRHGGREGAQMYETLSKNMA